MEHRIGFGPRFGAYLIDFIFVFGLGFILASLASDFLEKFVDFSKMTAEQLDAVSAKPIIYTLSILMPVAAVLITFVYNLIEGFLGFTVGKLMLGLQVGKQDGTPAELSKLMLRFTLKNISTIVGLIGLALMISVIGTVSTVLGFVVLIGCFFALGDKKLALHDIIAKTAVFRKDELADGTASKPMFAPPVE